MRTLIIFLAVILAQFTQAQSLLTPELLWSTGRISLESSNRGGLIYAVAYTDIVTEKTRRTFYYFNIAQPKVQAVVIPLPEGAEHLSFLPDGRNLLFLKDNHLWLYDWNNKTSKPLNDFQISDYRLSADGSTLAYTEPVKYGSSLKEQHHGLANANARIIEHLNYRHLNTWTDEYYENLFVTPFNTNGMLQQGVNIMLGEPYDVLSFSISPDGQQVAYECKKMHPNEYAVSTNSDIFLYTKPNGKTINLSANILGYDSNPSFSPDGKYLAWSSMSTPVYETDRKRLMVHDLAISRNVLWIPDFDYNVNNPAWANDGIIFQTEIKGTTQLLKAVSNGGIVEITQGKHTVGSYFIVNPNTVYYTKSTFTSPPEIYYQALSDQQEIQLTTINKELMANIKFGTIEDRFTRTFDGKQLHYFAVYPPDFDPAKTYPCILYCQGGPQSALTNGWGFRWSLTLLAAQGYIVIAPSRRGVFGFGSEWTREVSESWGDKPMKDLLAAIDDFAQAPFVDKSRIAAIGASFGGYSVYWLAGNHDNRFKCFFAHAGLFNLETFDGMTDEKFFVDFDMGGPFFSRRSHPTYAEFSPHLHVEKWNRPILISHGGKDYRVLDTEGFQAFDAAQRLGLDAKMLYFPDEGHGIGGCHNSIVWYREVIAWLKKHIGD